ncbi:histidine kinase [Pseudochelatococcus contaminans]|uniref:Histidine kinase n=1 Tax=Pseudochelatococcus contaminans TaxID=1538103 RepID=A0A7W5Z5A3_9HYPH|nr:histidine kinase [Pseudochelatococcus contaminans]MBB3809964.1 hypothetical protein [Pseudochelatococcus contaminans]
MPTLFRLLIILGILAGLGYAALLAIVTFLPPETRQITVEIPAERLQR